MCIDKMHRIEGFSGLRDCNRNGVSLELLCIECLKCYVLYKHAGKPMYIKGL
jgi:hypothetical protein